MKPRLMIVSPVTPYPVSHGAGSAIYGYLCVLRNEFDLYFAGFCPEKVIPQAREGLRAICHDVVLLPPPERRYLDAFSPDPFYFSNLVDARLTAAVRAMHRAARPDLLQVEYLSMAAYAEGLGNVRVIRAHVQDWWHFYLGSRRSLSRRARFTQMLGCFDTIAHNRKVLNSFDRVLVTHHEEAQRARELAPSAHVEVLPFLLMDCDYFVPAAELTAEPNIVFVGFLPHTPNEEGLGWFLQNVWPQVRSEEPRAKLSVIGGGASNYMLGLMHDSGADYLGYVEDVRNIYRQSRVYIAPIFTGGGIRTKVLEAMTAGVPIVCTSFAPLGIGTQPGEHLLAADSAEDYARAVVRLCRENELAERVRHGARTFIENRYSLQGRGGEVASRYLEFMREAA